MTVNGKVVDANAENSLPDSGNIPVKVVVTDSRKRTATYSTNLSVSAYTTPVINDLTYVRGSYTESVWTENPSGADKSLLRWRWHCRITEPILQYHSTVL